MNSSGPSSFSFGRLSGLLAKALGLFVIFNFGFGCLQPGPWLGSLTLYGSLFPARLRLPYGDHPERAYNLSLFNLEAMFATHAVNQPKPQGEYRVILIGDSATWGFLLPADQTLPAAINAAHLKLADGRQVRAYNLGYPVMSLTKDLLLLSYARRYQPDLIIWPVTLESFPNDKQLFPPLLQANPAAVRALIQRYRLQLDPEDAALKEPSWWDRTLIGQRRDLADLIRLQLYGVLWAATGIDQDLPTHYTPRQEDLPADLGFHGLQPPVLPASALALDVLEAGMHSLPGTPVLLVNEPMFVSRGQNSDLRYNFFYPRWAYDEYRRLLQAYSAQRGWQYYDAWQAVSAAEFTNSAVHMTSAGTQRFADLLLQIIPTIVKKP